MPVNHSILIGDALAMLKTLPDESIQCVVTSPPYWGLRNYGVEGQIGQEPTPQAYVETMVQIFREVRRVLKNNGVFWLNLGDSYARDPKKGQHKPGDSGKQDYIIRDGGGVASNCGTGNLPEKNLIGIPWRVAFALQADGWTLRQDIIWHKPNCMPESVRDRCTRSHEYVFMFAKSARYFYDADAISEPCSESTVARLSQNVEAQAGSTRGNGGAKTNGPMKAVGKIDKQRGHSRRHDGFNDRWDKMEKSEQCSGMRNKRSVWKIAPRGYRGAHFAVFPAQLAEPCILAGSRAGDTVLDPFAGSGTTGEVALKSGRNAVLIELNPAYVPLIEARVASVAATC